MLERRTSTLVFGTVVAAIERAAQRDTDAATATAMRLRRTLVRPASGTAGVAKEVANAERAERIWAELS